MDNPKNTGMQKLTDKVMRGGENPVMQKSDRQRARQQKKNLRKTGSKFVSDTEVAKGNMPDLDTGEGTSGYIEKNPMGSDNPQAMSRSDFDYYKGRGSRKSKARTAVLDITKDWSKKFDI